MNNNLLHLCTPTWRPCFQKLGVYVILLLCSSFQIIYLIFYQNLNFSTTWVIPTFGLVGKLNSRSRNTPYGPTTTRLKHGFMCVFLWRKDLTIFMDIELNPGPYHLGSSSFQLNRALLISIYSTERLRTCFNWQICSLCLHKRWPHQHSPNGNLQTE